MAALSQCTQWVVLLILLSLSAVRCQQDPVRPYPLADSYLQTTSFLNHSAYIDQYADQQWLLDNIPFIDLPDKTIEDVYYYRATVIKRHLRWTHEGEGWVFTEFYHPVSWASKLQTIPDSAPYHVLEGRWLRDQKIAKNLIESYTRGGVENFSGITYTHFMQRAILEHAQATGDQDFLTSQLQGMIQTYDLWNITRDPTTGLYHRNPLQDAQEYSLPGYLTGGPGGGPMQTWDDFGLSAGEGGGNNYALIWLGPETYRPSQMSYMIANAYAISEVASIAGESALASTWSAYADDLYAKMLDVMWSEELQFWIDVVEGTNFRCLGRELIGYYPYRFGVGTNSTFVKGLEYGLDNEHFISEFGPTTLEQVNPYFTALKNTTYCCQWNGQSWPFSTSVFLTVLATMARENVSSVATPQFFYNALETYAKTNYKDGVPYTAESHYPTINMWSGDTTNHSENYFHSTYADNIFTNLIGIVPTLDDVLQLQPLIPSNWSNFAVENLPYHGSLISIVWDQTGGHYSGNCSAGLSVYSNGTLIHNQKTLAPVNVTLPFKGQEAASALAAQPEYQNILANPNTPWGLPVVTADWLFTSNSDVSPYGSYKLNDGLFSYDTTPDNRWTNNQSTSPYNTVTVTLPRARNLTSVSLGIFVDTDRGGVIGCPASLRVTDGNGTVVAYRANYNETCVPNQLNTISFDTMANNVGVDNETTPALGNTVETDVLHIALNSQLGLAVALTEVELWVPPNLGPRYEAEDGLIGTFIGYFEGRATGVNGSVVDGGVQLNSGGWVELAGVMAPASITGQGGPVNLTVIGGQTGTVDIMLNWLSNYTVAFDGSNASQTVEVQMLPGANNVDIFQTAGNPWIDAIVVG